MTISLHDLVLLLGALATIVGLLRVTFVFGGRIEKLELKVDTMWGFQMRRAESELVGRGLGEKNSPLIISEEAKQWLNHLQMELRAFYRQLGRELSMPDLMMEIERRYGERILNEVCIPHGLFEGACLLIAAAVAKGEDIDAIPLTRKSGGGI